MDPPLVEMQSNGSRTAAELKSNRSCSRRLSHNGRDPSAHWWR